MTQSKPGTRALDRVGHQAGFKNYDSSNNFSQKPVFPKSNNDNVYKFIKQNDVFVELHPFYFIVKDQFTKEILPRGACNNGMYTFPSTPLPNKVAFMYEWTSIDGWYKRLGHPSFKLVHSLVNRFSLRVTSHHVSSLCRFCSINKAHQLLFRATSFHSHALLNFIYTDVWGTSAYTGIDGSQYYLLLVNHYMKYMWFYPITHKSEVSIIFP